MEKQHHIISHYPTCFRFGQWPVFLIEIQISERETLRRTPLVGVILVKQILVNHQIYEETDNALVLLLTWLRARVLPRKQ